MNGSLSRGNIIFYHISLINGGISILQLFFSFLSKSVKSFIIAMVVCGRIPKVFDFKSVNLQYNTLGCLDDGTNESSTKHLMFQVLLFFHDFLQNSLKKSSNLFSYFFHKVTKIKIKSFECPKSIKSMKKKWYLEHETLGRRFICPIVQATQLNIL